MATHEKLQKSLESLRNLSQIAIDSVDTGK